MTPNICAPVDRSPEAMQGIRYRGDGQAFAGSVDASGLPCTICKAGCSLLSGVAKQACETACDITVC